MALKRTIDFTFSLIALVVLFPISLLVALCIYFEDKGPVFYKQQRVGKNEKLFTLFKFRSMRVNQISPLELGAVKDAHPLVTKVGYFIRRFKFDEIPQLLNVLRGEMSLVGPRPCLPGRLASMTEVQKKRFQALPGLSGWAEVNGNLELSWEEQVVLDVWYVQHRSLFLDLKIILQTLYVVFCGSHRNETALALAKKFSGDS